MAGVAAGVEERRALRLRLRQPLQRVRLAPLRQGKRVQPSRPHPLPAAGRNRVRPRSPEGGGGGRGGARKEGGVGGAGVRF